MPVLFRLLSSRLVSSRAVCRGALCVVRCGATDCVPCALRIYFVFQIDKDTGFVTKNMLCEPIKVCVSSPASTFTIEPTPDPDFFLSGGFETPRIVYIPEVKQYQVFFFFLCVPFISFFLMDLLYCCCRPCYPCCHLPSFFFFFSVLFSGNTSVGTAVTCIIHPPLRSYGGL